jgi:hypothetical protein
MYATWRFLSIDTTNLHQPGNGSHKNLKNKFRIHTADQTLTVEVQESDKSVIKYRKDYSSEGADEQFTKVFVITLIYFKKRNLPVSSNAQGSLK